MPKENDSHARIPWTHPRTLLKSYGLSPNKSFGQNFLTDPNFSKAIAESASPDENNVILEIGPGTGVLTRALLNQHPKSRILAVELDAGLANLMQNEFQQQIDEGRLTIIQGDALDGKHHLNQVWVKKWLAISRDENRPRRVLCANLPYNASTPLIANMALASVPDTEGHQESFCHEIIATIQLELAQRLLASNGTKSYGSLSAFLNLRTTGKLLRNAGPGLFWPRPKVSSAVIQLSLRPWPEVAFKATEADSFMTFLQSVFLHRRKSLRTLLKDRINIEGPMASQRAEQLTPNELFGLWREIS